MERSMSARDKLLVGQPVERVEDARFLTGQGTFVDDVDRPGLLHAAILRSSVAHGRIARIDAGAALAMPGVRAVFTAADIGAVIPRIPLRLARIAEYERYRQPVIAADKVRYVGEPIAVVVADSRALAEDALELIELEIDQLPPVANRFSAEADTDLLFEEAGTNVALRYTAAVGDPDSAFKSADYVRRETFRVHRHTAVPMETRGLVAEWDGAGSRLTLTGATKVAFFNRRALAQMLDLPEKNVDLIEVDVGGGFGVRGEFYPEDFLIPFAAKALGSPVKWIEDRREHLIATNHSREVDCELEIACARDGTILGLHGRVFADMGAYIRTNGGVVPAKTAQFLPGPYRIRNVGVEVSSLMTNKTPVGTYRGPGRFETNFFRERLLDMAARDLKIDPVEFRRKNLITEAELPYSLGALVPYENEAVLDTGNYHATFDRCLEEIGWAEKIKQQGMLINGRRHGVGVACFIESGGAGPQENARIALDADGMVTVSVGSAVLGQGLETVFTQIAADALGVAADRIRILHGSTTLLDEGWGTYASRAVVMGGSAILDGARKLRETILEAAAEQLKCPGSAMSISGDRVIAANGPSITFAELGAARIGSGMPLITEGTFSNTKLTFSYGAHAAHVAVDPRTGHVEVLDYIAVEDIGRAINPMIVHGQSIGAIVQGLGGVFLDHLVYDDQAQFLNASLADYLLPTATDFPNIRTVTMELCHSPSNPLGAKGAGEGGIVAVAAATANAVSAALGVDVTELPLSPPKVWALIEAGRSREMTSKAPLK